MLRWLKGFWDAIVFAGTFVGLVYLPANLYGLFDAYPWLRKWAEIDRFSLLVVFSGVAVLYIIWADARPYVRTLLSRRTVDPIKIDPNTCIYCESHFVAGTPSEERLYANIFYLIVGNGLTSGATLRSVQCHLFTIGEPIRLRVKADAQFQTDIRNGEFAFFQLGQFVSEDVLGWVKPTEVELGDSLKGYRHNVSQRTLTFDLAVPNGQPSHSLASFSNQKPTTMTAVVSADDVVARQVLIEIDFGSPKRPISCKLPT